MRIKYDTYITLLFWSLIPYYIHLKVGTDNIKHIYMYALRFILVVTFHNDVQCKYTCFSSILVNRSFIKIGCSPFSRVSSTWQVHKFVINKNVDI